MSRLLGVLLPLVLVTFSDQYSVADDGAKVNEEKREEPITHGEMESKLRKLEYELEDFRQDVRDWQTLSYDSPLGSGRIEVQEVFVVLIVCGSSLLVTWQGMSLILKLWRLVLSAVADAESSKNAKAIIELLGGFTAEGEVKPNVKYRIAGVGLLGTLLILGLCVVVVWLLVSTFPIPTGPGS